MSYMKDDICSSMGNSSQGLVLGLAPRATGAAVLDKNLCYNCSAAPGAW